MQDTLDAAAGEIARHQHGLITRQQAIDAGLSPAAILTRRRAERWVTVERSVYAINGAPMTWRAKLLAVCLGLGAVASHRSGAQMLRVDGFHADLIEVTIPRGRAVIRNGIVLHESTDLHLFDPVLIDGIPCTPAERLAVDLGAAVTFDRYDRAVEELIRRKLTTWPMLVRQLIQHSRRGRDGVGSLRALLTERYGDDVGESVLEREFLKELRRRGLPEPEKQYVVVDRDGFIARVDFAYPHLRIVIELDGRRYHGDAAFEADRIKRDRLTAAGWHVQEITWRMLFDDPHNVFRRLERLLKARSVSAEVA